MADLLGKSNSRLEKKFLFTLTENILFKYEEDICHFRQSSKKIRLVQWGKLENFPIHEPFCRSLFFLLLPPFNEPDFSTTKFILS